MPKTFDSMLSFMLAYSFENMRSSESLSSSRYIMRLTVMSLLPSCIQRFIMQGSSCLRPISSAMARQREVCSTQKSRMPLSGLASVRFPLLGCENDVELKSSFMPFSAAHCIQLSKCDGSTSLRSTNRPPKSPYISCRLRRCLPGMNDIAFSMSMRTSSMLRALPG